jgi:16S rRNA (guanine(966)-N(2))-methyltransferase RsmD
MRVISGTARGRPLRAAKETRPTADLIKGAIFSMLEALAYKRGFEPDEDGNLAAALAWPRVLDLFAGSGGLGIEALSRGAQAAEFVEQDRDAARIIQANLRSTGVEERAKVYVSPVSVVLSRVMRPVDLVFLDPPYADTSSVESTLQLLANSTDLLLPTSLVVLEHSAQTEPPEVVGPLHRTSARRHGRTRITLYAQPQPRPRDYDPLS